MLPDSHRPGPCRACQQGQHTGEWAVLTRVRGLPGEKAPQGGRPQEGKGTGHRRGLGRRPDPQSARSVHQWLYSQASMVPGAAYSHWVSSFLCGSFLATGRASPSPHWETVPARMWFPRHPILGQAWAGCVDQDFDLTFGFSCKWIVGIRGQRSGLWGLVHRARSRAYRCRASP